MSDRWLMVFLVSMVTIYAVLLAYVSYRHHVLVERFGKVRGALKDLIELIHANDIFWDAMMCEDKFHEAMDVLKGETRDPEHVQLFLDFEAEIDEVVEAVSSK